MKLKFHYPLWVHLPAALLAAFCLQKASAAEISFLDEMSLPGSPDKLVAVVGIAEIIFLGVVLLLVLGISAWVDEGYARRETQKTFNWRSLLDELIIGAIIVVQAASSSTESDFAFSWIYLLPLAIGIASAAILEVRRPFRPYQSSIVREDITALEAELAERWKSGQTATYWEVFMPPIWQIVLWVALITIPLIRGLVAGLIIKQERWLLVLLASGAPLLFLHLAWMRLRVSVTREQIVIRGGRYGYPFRPTVLSPAQVEEVDVRLIETADDFLAHGYGFRAYGADLHRVILYSSLFFARLGKRYVRIVMTNGKKYLIAANYPDRLAAAIHAAKAAAVAWESLAPLQSDKGQPLPEEASAMVPESIEGGKSRQTMVSSERYSRLNWLVGLVPAGITAILSVVCWLKRDWISFGIAIAFFSYSVVSFCIFNRRN